MIEKTLSLVKEVIKITELFLFRLKSSQFSKLLINPLITNVLNAELKYYPV